MPPRTQRLLRAVVDAAVVAVAVLPEAGAAAAADGMLLSGTLGGGEALANRALAVDVPMGQGHMVMFALRPFWRWQTQGTFMLVFNAILNWDHLDAGKAAAPAGGATEPGQ